MNGNHNSANDFVVGQVVLGIIEATFDDRCMLAVRVGSSENALSGFLFKQPQCTWPQIFGTANLGTSRARQAPPSPIQIAHPVPRSKVVPVVTVANQPSPILNLPNSLESSEGKRVREAAYPSNG
ncbi:hypothetical protein QYF36_017941 [Acer negundo]|nr:hypothetical protein QYF36_017941 [Acer negundo]